MRDWEKDEAHIVGNMRNHDQWSLVLEHNSKVGVWVLGFKHAIWEREREREVLKLERRQNVKKCVGEENRDKGEIKKTKGEENVAENKTEKKKKSDLLNFLGYSTSRFP